MQKMEMPSTTFRDRSFVWQNPMLYEFLFTSTFHFSALIARGS
jgi:hypothetical protein